MLDLDIRTFNNLVDGYTINRETRLNDELQIGHIIAGKISQAVWGDKQFKKPISPIELFKDEADINNERNKKVIATLKAKGVI